MTNRPTLIRDFNRQTIRILAHRGITIVGFQSIPDMTSPMPFANAERGYVVDDNGTSRVLTHRGVLALAGRN